mmetsp:Transcript_37006/g.55350  ORF Transcript_37006/g.55350 Transcript_37006/m.55350 type:complete len:142 (-) Transcript_37006:38-463(-)
MNYDKETCKMLGICFHETSTVQSNDCIFAIHAAFMSCIYIVQILIYNRSSFELRRTTMVLLFMMVATAVRKSDIVLVDCNRFVKQAGFCSCCDQFEDCIHNFFFLCSREVCKFLMSRETLVAGSNLTLTMQSAGLVTQRSE